MDLDKYGVLPWVFTIRLHGFFTIGLCQSFVVNVGK